MHTAAAVTAVTPHAPDETDRLINALGITIGGDVERRRSERHADLALLRAMRLARDLETCEAILRGERVPVSRLDPEWAKAYGYR